MSLADDIAALRTRHESRFTEFERVLLLKIEQIQRKSAEAGNEFQVSNVVSHRTGQGLLDVVWLGQLTQVDPVKAREMAWILLEAASVAEVEAAVTRFMRERVGLSAEKAAVMLSDFRHYRESGPDSSLVGSKGH